MRSKYESLSDGALFRFLKIILEEFRRIQGDIDLPKSSAKTSATLSTSILKKYGLSLDEIDINYFWVCLLFNHNQVESGEKLPKMGLTRPEIKNYEVTIEFYGSCSYSEYMDVEYQSYNEETAKDIRNINIEMDNDYYGYETGDCDQSDFSFGSITEIPLSESKKKKNKKVIQEQNSSNELNIDNLSLYELVNLKEQIENRIIHKMNIG